MPLVLGGGGSSPGVVTLVPCVTAAGFALTDTSDPKTQVGPNTPVFVTGI